MNSWDKSSNSAGPASASERLAQAWQNVKRGTASIADGEVILADLAASAGHFAYFDRAPTPDEALFDAGKRAVSGRLLSFINLSRADREKLQQAALDEARASME